MSVKISGLPPVNNTGELSVNDVVPIVTQVPTPVTKRISLSLLRTYIASLISPASIGAIPTSEKGVASGVATLDSAAKVPASQLPSYVDDVLEFANLAAFPVTGETGKIYIALDTGKTYRWTGTVYLEISNTAAAWGTITGTLSAQTDLQTALDARLKLDGSNSMAGNLDFAGTGRRITGDMSNATHANRLAFQTNVANAATSLTIVPNGTGGVGQVNAFSGSDTVNAQIATFVAVKDDQVSLRSNIVGSAAYVPLTFYTGGTERMRLSATANRFQADFSNSLPGSRLCFQDSGANQPTVPYIIPNGTSPVAGISCSNSSDPANASDLTMFMNGANAYIQAGKTGTGTYTPLNIFVGASNRLVISTAGLVTAQNSIGLGYGIGSGGTVTQATNKATAVTLNKPTGVIITTADSIPAGGVAQFSLLNNTMTSDDILLVCLKETGVSPANYALSTMPRNANDGAYISIRNVSGGPLAEALSIRFVVIKGSSS